MGVADPDSTGPNRSRGSPKAAPGSTLTDLTRDRVALGDRTAGQEAVRGVQEAREKTVSAVLEP